MNTYQTTGTLANTLFLELEQAETTTGLPERVGSARVSKLVGDTYFGYGTG